MTEPPGEFNPPPPPIQPNPDEGPWGSAASADVPGLYLHVPFCFHKCHYCDFYSIVEKPGEGESRQQEFVTALLAELAARVEQAPRRPRTIFVGGGTPTLLTPRQWRRLLGGMRGMGVLDRVDEFTVEANPETVTPELMAVLAGGGVNRVSLGAQSFDPAMLKALERWHDPASVGRAIGHVRAAGIHRFNLDLIFAIPGQTLERFDADLDAVLALGPEHVSCYGLTYEPNTAMTVKLGQGRIQPAAEDLERRMYEHVIQRLADAGFEHYEISAWAKPGRRCAHNVLYWSNGDWLGVGPAAASHIAGRRWRNQPHLGRYLAGAPTPPAVDYEHLSADDAVGEALMMRLRLREGVPAAWLDEHVSQDSNRRVAMHQLTAQGLLAWDEAGLRLTHRGLLLADGVIAELL